MRISVVVCLFLIASVSAVTYQTVEVLGDSVSRGFNARQDDDVCIHCDNGDHPDYSWGAQMSFWGNSDYTPTPDSKVCLRQVDCPQIWPLNTTPLDVYSVGERFMHQQGAGFPGAIHLRNHAVTGATVLNDLYDQARYVVGNATAHSTIKPQRIFVLLGHNDVCSGTAAQNTTCSSSDRDPSMYCTVKPSSFRREMIRGLDQLVSVSNSHITVVNPIRVSQLCNFKSKGATPFGVPGVTDCGDLWALDATLSGGICKPLTASGGSENGCDNSKALKVYERQQAYRSIIIDLVTNTYQHYTAGQITSTGTTVASGVTIDYSDNLWVTKFMNANQISACDCFHPTLVGQETIAQHLFGGVNCASTADSTFANDICGAASAWGSPYASPCCLDSSTPTVANALCTATTTTGSHPATNN